MLFEPGFLGTKALMYMDIVTLYFAALPFLLGLSILFAIRGHITLHYRSQISILLLTVAMVVLFETGVRITGGFAKYAPQSFLPYDFLALFLAVHVLLALLAVGGWIYLILSSYRAYRHGALDVARHVRIGRPLFAALTLTSLMGVSIYVFLFV